MSNKKNSMFDLHTTIDDHGSCFQIFLDLDFLWFCQLKLTSTNFLEQIVHHLFF